MKSPETLQQFITSNRPLLFLLTKSAAEGSAAMQELAKEAALLTSVFYVSVESALDSENFSAVLEKKGLPIHLPNFSSGAQQAWCLQKLQALPSPVLLIIDHAHLLPNATLAGLYELVRYQKEPLQLHIILTGNSSLKELSKGFADSYFSKNSVFFSLNQKPEKAVELTEAAIPTPEKSNSAYWKKHKIKTISFVILIVLLMVLHLLRNQLDRWSDVASSNNAPAFAAPTTPPEVQKAKKIIKKVLPPKPTLPMLDTDNQQKTAQSLVPPLPVSKPVAAAPVASSPAPIGWPGEKMKPSAAPSKLINIAQKNPSQDVIARRIADSTKQSSTTNNNVVTNTTTNYYTLQLIASPHQNIVSKLQAQLNIANESQILEKNNQGKTWYFLLEGKYSTMSEAKSALTAFQTRFPGQKPWIRAWG